MTPMRLSICSPEADYIEASKHLYLSILSPGSSDVSVLRVEIVYCACLRVSTFGWLIAGVISLIRFIWPFVFFLKFSM